MNREALINLRRILAQLFDTPSTIRRIAADVGIALARVDLQGSIINRWDALLTEAEKSNQLVALVQVAAAKYPNRGPELLTLLRAWMQTSDEIDPIAGKGLTFEGTTNPVGMGTLGFGDEPPLLESFPAGGASAAMAPVQRRLDVAAPGEATLGRSFSLAVAVCQLGSPQIKLDHLPEQQSGRAQLHWPEAEAFVRLRIEIAAPECEIVGPTSRSFRLYRDYDSEIFYFSLIPQVVGRLNLIVSLYQEDDMLGSALTFTNVIEHEVGQVQVRLQSSQPIALPQEHAARRGVAMDEGDFWRSQLDQHKRNLQLLLQQKAMYAAGEEPLRLLNQIDAEVVTIAQIEADLQQINR